MSENFFCGPKTQVMFPDLGLEGTCLDYRTAEMSRLGGDEFRKDALYGMCTRTRMSEPQRALQHRLASTQDTSADPPWLHAQH